MDLTGHTIVHPTTVPYDATIEGVVELGYTVDTGSTTINNARVIVNRIRDNLARIAELQDDITALFTTFRDEEMWRELGYKSLDECIRDEFEMSRAHFYRNIDREGIYQKHDVELPHASVQKIKHFDDDKQARVIQVAKANAGSGSISNAHVDEAVNQVDAQDYVQSANLSIIEYFVQSGDITWQHAREYVDSMAQFDASIQAQLAKMLSEYGLMPSPEGLSLVGAIIRRNPQSYVLRDLRASNGFFSVGVGDEAQVHWQNANYAIVQQALDHARMEHILEKGSNEDAVVITVYPANAEKTANVLRKTLGDNLSHVLSALVKVDEDE